MIQRDSTINTILFFVVVLEYLALLFLGQGIKKVLADNFSSDARIESSQFFFTFALGYKLDSVSDSIDFQKDKLSGYVVSELASLNFDSLTSKSETYSRVISNKDTLALPPGTDIYLDMYSKNETHHTVGVKNAWLFTEQYQKPGLSDIVEFSTLRYRNIVFTFSDELLTKGGESYELGPMGNFFSAQNGDVSLYTNEYRIGRMRDSIVVSNVHTECIFQPEKLPSIKLGFSVKNTGKIQESVTLEDKVDVNLLPGEVREYEDLLYETGKESTLLSVVYPVTRCLQKGSDGSMRSMPDAYALLLARTDAASYTWTGSALNVPSEGVSEQFCITRMPYSILLPLPQCVVPAPRYEVSMNAMERDIKSGEATHVPVYIRNNGGTDAAVAGELLRVQIPDIWKKNVIFRVNGQVVSGEVFAQDGVRLHPIQPGEVLNGDIEITGPTVFSKEQAVPFIIELAIVDSTTATKLVPNSQSVINFYSLTGACTEGKFTVSISGSVEGNAEVEEVSIPLRFLATGKGGISAEIAIQGEKVTYEVPMNHETIVRINRVFAPGDFQVEIYPKVPPVEGITLVLAGEEKTASAVDYCPIVMKNSETPTPISRASELWNIPRQRKTSVLAVKDTPLSSVLPSAYVSPSITSEKTEADTYYSAFTLCSTVLALVIALSGVLIIFRPRKSGSR